MGKRIVIVGAGPGGYAAAFRSAAAGGDVTVIEKDEVGGTCLNYGCIPTKTFKTGADLLEKCHSADAFGIDISGEIRADMNRLVQKKTEVVNTLKKGLMQQFRAGKIQIVNGRAGNLEKNKVSVKKADGNEIEIPWDALILAPGTRPMDTPAFRFDGKHIISSTDALELSEIPESVLIIGGGVIGCEFAFILSVLGSRVTVVEALDRLLPLPSVDENCSKILFREMKKRKIPVFLNRSVNHVENMGGCRKVTIGPSPFSTNRSSEKNEEIHLEIDKVLVCIGRNPVVDRLGLDRIGVDTDGKGWIIANAKMETNVPGVYAVGDALGPSKSMLAHTASAEGIVAADNALGKKAKMDYGAIPGAIFTMPEIGNVGLTESGALGKGIDARSTTTIFRVLGKAHAMGELSGEAKIVWEDGTRRVLGVHVIGPHATELIAEGGLALQMGATIDDIASTVHAHPTLAEIFMETAMKALEA